MAVLIQKSTNSIPVPQILTDTSTGQTGQTGLTGAAVGTAVNCTAGVAGSITISVSRPGAIAFTNGAGSVMEIGLGNYEYTPTITETGTCGLLKVHWVATGCGTQDSVAQIVGFDPTSTTNLGLTSLPSANPTASGGLITIGSGAGQLTLDGSGGISSITTTLTLIQALLGANQGLRNFTYDGTGNLSSFDVCIYSSSSNATTNDGVTGLVHKYSVSSTYNGSNQQTAQSTIQVS